MPLHAYFNYVARHFPGKDFPDLQEKPGFADFKRGNYNTALKNLLAQDEEHNLGTSGYFLVGWLHAENQDYKSAKTYIKTVISIYGHQTERLNASEKMFLANAYGLSAELYLKQGKNQRALEYADRILEISPNYAPAFAIKAQAYLNLSGDSLDSLPQVIAMANQTIQFEKNYPPAYILLSLAYLKNNNLDKAIKTTKLSIDINPNAIAYAILSEAYAKQGDYAAALKEAENALKLIQENNVSAIEEDFEKLSLSDIKTLQERSALYKTFVDLAQSEQKLEQNPDDELSNSEPDETKSQEETNALDTLREDINSKKQNIGKLSSGDIKNLQMRCELHKALIDLDLYKQELDTDLHDPNKKLTQSNKTKLQDKIAALNALKKDINEPLLSLIKGQESDSFKSFKKTLHSQDEVLGKHRGYGKLIKNIALAVGTLGVGYAFAGLINLAVTHGKHFTFFNDTTTIKKIKNIEKQVHSLRKPK